MKKNKTKNYEIIGKINCQRCNTVIKLRELKEPTAKQEKNGGYWTQWAYCYSCGDFNRDDMFKVPLTLVTRIALSDIEERDRQEQFLKSLQR